MPVNTQAFVGIYRYTKMGMDTHSDLHMRFIEAGTQAYRQILTVRKKKRLRPLPLTPTSNPKVIG